MNARDALDAAAEQRAGAVSDRGEIDRSARHERAPVDFRRHAALADDDIAAREVEPAVEPFRETKRRGSRHRADLAAAVRIDRGGRRAVEIDKAQLLARSRQAEAVLDRALVGAFARREHAP